MAMAPAPPAEAKITVHQEKVCLVTVGATSVFPHLLEESLRPTFLASLRLHKYSTLILQCGPSKFQIDKLLDTISLPAGLQVETHNLLPSLTPCIRRCMPGIVIGHAGSGTIIDVLAEGARMIAVPNAELKDNHQEETAVEFARRGLVVKGNIGNLVKALEFSERTPKLKSATTIQSNPSFNLMDVVGTLALSGWNPAELLRQANDPSYYYSKPS